MRRVGFRGQPREFICTSLIYTAGLGTDVGCVFGSVS
jgi:hypothetical protein